MFFEKEGLKIEYKKCENKLPSSFWETYSAFANTEGGTIILGVDEKNGKFSVTGVQAPDRIVMDLFNQLNDRKKVSYNVVSDSDVIIEEIDNKSIIKVVVAEAFYENKPVYLKDNMRNTYIRLGEGDRQASSEELKAFVVNSHNDIDDELLEGYDIDDINTDTLERYRRILLNISEKNLK